LALSPHQQNIKDLPTSLFSHFVSYSQVSTSKMKVSTATRVHTAPSRVVRVSASSQNPQTKAARRELGKSGLSVAEMGLGAWSWGDRSGYWAGWTKDGARTAYDAAIATGLDFIDTAEVYGFGQSEEFIGEFMRDSKTSPTIATKFAPLPWKQTPASLVAACRASLNRLGVSNVGLYMQHWPGFFLNAFANDAYLEGLAQCKEQGLCEAVGVSNFNAARVNKAAKFLENRGHCLASNQVQYSLLYREPEKTGVMEACKENGTTLVAYSPICQGLLSGKYSRSNPPTGPRRAFFTDARFSEIEVLLDLMKKIGAEQGGKTPSQVALRWTLGKGALPIPGAKTAAQVEDLAGALGWKLSEGEMTELDKSSSRIPSSSGAPFEKW
jgi:aryl-alcohol dehydrogenase-like predicted oxidoreductase